MKNNRTYRTCRNCKFGQIDEKYYGYTHCTVFNTSFKTDSKCKKHEKED